MPAKKIKIERGLKITDDKLTLDGVEIKNITNLKIELEPGKLAKLTLDILVREIEISDEQIVKIDNVEIPPTVSNLYEKAIIEKLVENNLIDPERL